jgi:hypothetical protein
VNVEIVANDVPPHIDSGAAEQVAETSREILLRPGVADRPLDLAGGNVESGDQGLSAVTAVLELTQCGLRSASFLRNVPPSVRDACDETASPRPPRPCSCALCMLAYHLEWHMRQALRPILFEDDDTPKPKTKRPQLPIADLATLTRNIVAIEPDLENPS